ncbi:MAG: flotillin family protein, partial [Verrucomicrobiota bacterium]
LKEAEAAKEAAQLKADQELYEEVKKAEAARQASELYSEELLIKAEAEQEAAAKESVAKKTLAEGVAAESAATGIGEAQVLEARAAANLKDGSAAAEVIRLKAEAEAEGIDKKAEAMKRFSEAGQSHEEFKLRLGKEKEIELSEIDMQRDVAAEKARVMGEALRHSNIDIVGGDGAFFDRITGAITNGKVIERTMENSDTLREVKETFFNGDPDYFKSQLGNWIDQFGVTSEDLKNLTVSALLTQLMASADNDTTVGKLRSLLNASERMGLADKPAGSVIESLSLS